MVLQEVSEITTFPEALVNTGLGMGTVFIVLILISFIIYLLKFVPGLFAQKKAEKKEVRPEVPVVKETKGQDMAPKRASAPADDTQLIAVIMAAVAAQMEEETGVPAAADGFVIRSIKKRTFSL